MIGFVIFLTLFILVANMFRGRVDDKLLDLLKLAYISLAGLTVYMMANLDPGCDAAAIIYFSTVVILFIGECKARETEWESSEMLKGTVSSQRHQIMDLESQVYHLEGIIQAAVAKAIQDNETQSKPTTDRMIRIDE